MPEGAPDLKRWSCYVDDIDDDHVHLVMADEAEEGDGREIGSFPRHLLAHLDPREGQLVTVRITAAGGLDISNTPISDEDRARGEARVAELIELLRWVRERADEDDGREGR